ncbi:hypothetical protein [Flavicella sediminum]|uniref:hypothetical protein n=1 Tax=Flavicella sediminum TaxID=2585141 RepID=UPI00111D41A5|nr:hypothetical protein [Flavicella sediminum]
MLVFSFIYSSCSPEGNSDTEFNSDSTPSVPILTFPSQDQLCLTNTLKFTWDASINEDGSSVIYIFEIAKDNLFSNKVSSEVLTSLSKFVILEKGFAYYWRVKARSSKNIESEYSSISQFYTEEIAESNHLPFAPELILPFFNQSLSSINTTTLEWRSSDVDNDPLKYDVYFGKDEDSLTLMIENLSDTSFKVNLDPSAATYYWKIVVKDDKGGKTTGQLWSFSAED